MKLSVRLNERLGSIRSSLFRDLEQRSVNFNEGEYDKSVL